jgi:hypothetical protein
MLQPDRTYIGTIVSARLMQSKAKKTPGFQLGIETSEGDTAEHIIWLTPKNKERAETDFQTLGVDLSRLGSRSYIEHELPGATIGKEIEFGTKSETYNDRTTVKVSWIQPAGAATTTDLADEVAHLWGGPQMALAGAGRHPGEDDDIGF